MVNHQHSKYQGKASGECIEASLSPPVPPDMDSIPGFMVDCHGEKWFKDTAATMRDINGPYHYRSWSLKTLTGTTWIDGYNADKKTGRMCF
jgi:hypothetical protein